MVYLCSPPLNVNYLDSTGMFSKGLTLQRRLKMEIFHTLFTVHIHVSNRKDFGTFSGANNASVVDVSCFRTNAGRNHFL